MKSTVHLKYHFDAISDYDMAIRLNPQDAKQTFTISGYYYQWATEKRILAVFQL